MPPPDLDLKAKHPLITWIQNPPSHPRLIPSCPGVEQGQSLSGSMNPNSSDKDDDGSGLPASGLMAPWEVLHGLADVAIQWAAKASQCKHPFSLFHSYATIVGEWQSK
ncbi:hypothetical protein F5148DRAFT_1326763 [Russula earlei]|uniref:Uncharacterized protein n=1 Tax=Russula earlei TaxID=71964 RepID=A0ACC0U0J6_9AGAM|nr:hypothetical protein F5148DRAFT_1326763 [Russula earlei]